MSAKIIDGKSISASVKASLKPRAAGFEKTYGRKIGLAVVQVGENPASKIYVSNKIKSCEEVGIKSFAYFLPDTASESEVIELIETINNDNNIDGLLVQLPLPAHINEVRALAAVSPDKDADGFSAVNAGNMLLGKPCSKACTPAGIIELIKSTGEDISGRHAVVVGRSNIVGKPAAVLLLEQNATVTVCHSRTKDLKKYTLDADILVAAIGKKEFITGDMVKPGSIVIDVGMNREDGKLYGDVQFDGAAGKAAYITPVPGGVGPMTVAMLMYNTVEAAYRCKKS